jgi:hypothetical protein
MLGRLFKTAPTLAAALLLCGCSTFASNPPMVDVAGGEAAGSLKDGWAPNVVQAAATKLYAAPAGKPNAPMGSGPPQGAASCQTDRDCIVMLAALIKDPKRRWIGRPQTAAEYANGTRFFAYRALRTRLSCRELKRAIADIKVAVARLQASASGVSAAQAASALSLSTAVGTELRNEAAGRCRATPLQSQARASLAPSSELADHAQLAETLRHRPG